ncbi:MAG: lysS [Candidatus Magasanikbacteria bacterium]|nr:lysS [Candidatus Magasanikbacteria bacterium]
MTNRAILLYNFGTMKPKAMAANPIIAANPIEESASRLSKLERIKKSGANPYPQWTGRTHTIANVLENFDVLAAEQKEVVIAGRLRALRGQGGTTFGNLEDASGRVQVFFRKDNLPADLYLRLEKEIDLGDFLAVYGKLMTTKTGEKTVLVTSWRLISKALLPLPDKFHGLADVEMRYRQRYLDLLANPESMRIAKIRSNVVKWIREFFDHRDFIEVETPILQAIPGGASARPFKTHHNALDVDLYLRVAPELYLKRLIVGGFEKVYEMARCFRNEGIDHAHNPEFTQIEFYWAYADYEMLMKLTEELLGGLVERIYGKRQFEYEGAALNFKAPFPRLTFRDVIFKETKIDLDKVRETKTLKKEIEKYLRTIIHVQQATFSFAGFNSFSELADQLYKYSCRPKIIQPTFITDYPAEMIPLAKRKEDDQSKIATMQLVVNGLEICKAYNELNDPIDQEERFHEQQALRERGAEEAMWFDEDYVIALKHGMPPTAGFGMGIDRLLQVLTGSHNLKEVILFPTLRPK